MSLCIAVIIKSNQFKWKIMNICVLTFSFKFTSSHRHRRWSGHVLCVCYGFEFNFLSIMIHFYITHTYITFSILFYLAQNARNIISDIKYSVIWSRISPLCIQNSFIPVILWPLYYFFNANIWTVNRSTVELTVWVTNKITIRQELLDWILNGRLGDIMAYRVFNFLAYLFFVMKIFIIFLHGY